ncbi:hypothetical protein AVEN_258759-1 [Araneus ventricosus]|uniref:Uncharacterized protein n=1 Tax=Araneus ventricosus TaxID=182803 RepID=A0A4Y2D208_ARAVE|nr:hypothetical protein AVEN_258759-1 [Araneus ventricosus]
MQLSDCYDTVSSLILLIIRYNNEGHGGLVVRCRPRDWKVPGSKPDSIENPPCMLGRRMPNHTWGQTSAFGLGAEACKGGAISGAVPSYDRGSKLRGLSQNILPVSSKRDVDKTKLYEKDCLERLHLSSRKACTFLFSL